MVGAFAGVVLSSLLGALTAELRAQATSETGSFANAGADQRVQSTLALTPQLKLLGTRPRATLDLQYGPNLFASSTSPGTLLVVHNGRLRAPFKFQNNRTLELRLDLAAGRVSSQTLTAVPVFGDASDTTAPRQATLRFYRIVAGFQFGWVATQRLRFSHDVSARALQQWRKSVEETGAQLQVTARNEARYRLTPIYDLGAVITADRYLVERGMNAWDAIPEVLFTMRPNLYWTLDFSAGAAATRTDNPGSSRGDEIRWSAAMSASVNHLSSALNGKRLSFFGRASMRPYVDPFFGTLGPRSTVSIGSELVATRSLVLRGQLQWVSPFGIPQGLDAEPFEDAHIALASANVGYLFTQQMGLLVGLRGGGRWQRTVDGDGMRGRPEVALTVTFAGGYAMRPLGL